MTETAAWGGPVDRLELIKTSVRSLKLQGHALRQGAVPVDFDTVNERQRVLIARFLFDAMYRGRGVGLAAPMVGIGLRIAVISDGEKSWALFNPEIVSEGPGKTIGREANLCIPGIAGEVERPSEVTVRWLEIDGTEQERSFEGWTGRIMCHELELLDGKIFTDIANPDRTLTSNPDQRAAAATSHVFGKPEKRTDKPNPTSLSSCLTLPPSLLDLKASVLRRPADPVDFSTFKGNEFRRLVEAMFRQQSEQRGVGLAAPQIGLSLRLAVIQNHDEEPLVLINPEILDASEETVTGNEGCLSIPGWSGLVARSEQVRIRNHTVTGKDYEMTAEGYLARIVQHESDHLNGILYPDRIVASEKLFPTDHRTLAQAALESAQDDSDESSSEDSPASDSETVSI